MTLALLFDGNFKEYFARAGCSIPLLLFVHIPKTAGSSLHAELTPLLRPATSIEINYRDPTPLPYAEQLDWAVKKFIAGIPELRPRYASGHILPPHVARIRKAYPGTRCITMLRHPVARTVSDYRWQRSTKHPPHAEFRREIPTLEHYIAQPYENNKMAQYLVPAPILEKADPQACVDYIKRNYSFVGLQEMYDLSFQVITRLIGTPKHPIVRLRVNDVTDDNPLDLTDELEQAIVARNALDMAIYEAFAASFRAIRDDLTTYLERERATLARVS